MDEAQLALDARAELGEGPMWDAREQRLFWLNISAHEVHRFDPLTGRDEVFDSGKPVGTMAPRDAGGLVLAREDGFVAFEPSSGRLDTVAELILPGARMNDGKCDAQGRFWAGTMAYDKRQGAASLYRFDPGGAPRIMLSGVTISNGLDWSRDGSLMYYIDTPTHGVDVFDFDPVAGEIADRRRLISIPAELGSPDGMTVDAEGCVWVALYGGGAVHRYRPDGQLDGIVQLPASHVTCPVFGGQALDELFITTARENLTAEQIAQQPLAGGLFRLHPGVKGRLPNPFRG